MSRYVRVSAWVDVELNEIETDDLIEELKSRNVGISEGDVEDVTEMFYAFKLGKNERAMEIAKKIAQNHTGRIL
jgi:c-di-GMP-binding flagellar brake protein YcgR